MRAATTFVSKVPRDFVQRTLARLLPPRDRIAHLSLDELRELARKRDELRHLIGIDPVRFFRPNSGGQFDFMDWGSDHDTTVRIYVAGNKSGKSTAGAIVFLERLLGRSCWGLDTRQFSFPVPAKGACFAEDFDSHRETTIPTIRSWFPSSTIKREWRNSQGFVTEMELSNGSLVTFRTYDQGVEKAEGKDWDVVWCDEPPPRDVYVAMRRGLVVSNGLCVITATLVKEAWLFDEQQAGDFVKVFCGTIHDNAWISETGKQNFLSGLDDDERAVREAGKPASLVGVIYKEFRNSEPWVIDEFDYESTWPLILGIDPHERRPVHALYGVLTPEDDIVWLGWCLASGPASQVLATLREFEKTKFNASPTLVIMDPNRGKAIQMNGQSWSEAFEDDGYEVLLGNDDIRFGHTAVREYLKVSDDQPIPRMRFTKDCLGRNGPIFMMERYAWDDYRHRISRSQKERPRDLYKDFPDIVRYTAAARLEFSNLVNGAKVLDRRPSEWRRYHGVYA